MELTCSICFTAAQAPVGEFCPTCGNVFEACGVAPEPAPKPAPVPPAELVDSVETDELLDAFKAQFVERNMRVPAGWTRRLEQLANETEPSRRYAAIVFVDLVGYTRLSQVLPELRLLELRNWFNAVCSGEIERHGGFMIQFQGDAALAVFGAPWTFERDAEAALHCLLAIRESLRRKGSFDGEPLGVRAGAASGVINVVLSREGGRVRPDVVGSPVNLAARLEAFAQPFEIIVSGPMADGVRAAFDLEAREPFTPKNYGEVVTPYAVLGARRGDVQGRRGDLPFIGRAAEIARVREAIAPGHEAPPRVIVIRGEAGIGKTRLARESLAGLFPPGRVFHAQLEPHHRHTVLMPFVQLMSWLAAGQEQPAAVMEALRVAYPSLGTATMMALGVLVHEESSRRAMAGMPPAQLRVAVESAVLAVLEQAGRGQPIALVFDDLQWADALTLELLGKLTGQPPTGVSLLLVLRGDDPRAVSQLDRLAGLDSIELGPLSDAERVELLGHVLDLRALNPLVRDRMLEDSGGIPLCLIELGIDLIESPTATHSAEALVAQVVEARALDHYRRLTEIFQARIDRLKGKERLTLQCGAVLGRRFRESLLGGFEELRERLVEYLGFLKGARFLDEEPLPDDREMRFAPPLLRDVAYQMIAAEMRPALHRRFAELIEQRFPDRLGEFAAELATHWLKGNEFSAAVRWIRQACQQWLRYGVPQQAYALASEGLRQAPSSTDDSVLVGRLALLHEQAALAAFLASDFSAALRHIAAWEATYSARPNPIGSFNAGYRRALVEYELGHSDAMVELIGTLKPANRAQENMREELRAKLALRRNDLAGALALFLEGARREESAHAGLAGDSWSNAGLCLTRLGRTKEAADAFQHASAAYARLGNNRMGQCLALNNLGILQQDMGDLAAAIETYSQAFGLAESCGYIHGLSALHANLSYLRYLRGESREALDHAAQALYLARLIGHAQSEVVALINLALAHELTDRLFDANDRIEEAEQCARLLGDAALQDEIAIERAWILTRRGERAGALAVLQDQGGDLSPDLESYRNLLAAHWRNEALPRPNPFSSQTARIRLAAMKQRLAGVE